VETFDNQLAAQLLVQHQLASKEQILALWPQLTPEKHIAALLLENGLLAQTTCDQLVAHVNRTSPAAIKPPAPPPPGKSVGIEVGKDDSGNLTIEKGLREMLRQARILGVTDIHLSAGTAIHCRMGGRLAPSGAEKCSREGMIRIMEEALGSDLPRFEKQGDWESVLDWGELGRFRITALRQRVGYDLTIRLIPQGIRDFEESQLPESCRELCHWAQGLVLVTGPAGCGKTSTLATLVNLVNQKRRDHIITLEDPIEILYRPEGCQITQRQIGRHTQSREAALRAALREDPDIIVISELRDLDTIQLAVSAAETGHLVFGTMNTINATRTIYRLIDSFPPEEQGIIRSMVSESLRGVISQQLLPRKDKQGVIPAYEVLIVNSAVANMIRKDEAHQLGTAMITGKGSGMVVLDDSLRKLVETGLIEPEEAWSRATNPKDFERYMVRK